MAYKEAEVKISMDAGADLSSSQHLFVTSDASGDAVVAGAGVRVVGVLDNDPTSGQAAGVAIEGVTKVIAGAAVAAGADVASSAAGKAITSTSGDYIAGVALQAATADGDLIAVRLSQPGRTA